VPGVPEAVVNKGTTREVKDLIVMSIPEAVHVDRDDMDGVVSVLDDIAAQAAIGQYEQHPPVLLLGPTEWTITDDPADLVDFEPIHDCDRCRDGKSSAIEFLTANPGRWIALGNMTYMEVWQ
jgi:hypothetical protein